MDKARKNLTGPEQIEVLQNLTQQAAAWLIEMTSRSLRDHVGIPRASDGCYNARELVKWAAGRVDDSDLAGDDLERAMNASELLFFAVMEERGAGVAVALADYLAGLADARGEAGLVAFGRELTRQCRTLANLERAEAASRRLKPEERRAEIEARLAEETEKSEQAEAEAALDFAVVCESCGRLRRGRRWVTADPPAGRRVLQGYCPDAPQCGQTPARRRAG